VEEPFVLVGQIATVFYFFWFIILLPVLGILESKLVRLNSN
jgi:hypothetical protein